MAEDLTISEAVQRYEVSRKTVRRRLAEGAIEGARQRPGDHGPEWIFPASSLDALGYRLRDESDEDAAAPVPVGEQTFEEDEPRSRRGVAAVWVLVALILGPLLGFLLANMLGGDDEAADPVRPVAAVLDELTRPGDEIGIIGALAPELPDGRMAVTLEPDDFDVADSPVRYVVVDADAPADVVTSLQGSARVVLALEQAADAVWIFDTEAAPVRASVTSAAPEATTPTTAPPTTTPPTTAPAPTADPEPEVPVEGGSGAEDVEGEGDEAVDPTPGTTVRGTVTVEAGDHFWSIAEDIVTESLGSTPTDAQVTTYWAALVDANVDQLVEPGNPDLLLPGQVLQLPSV